MSILREKFWILKSRKTVRDVVRRCVRCRRYSSKSPVSDPKRIRYRRKLIEDFRSRFRKEYLGQLRQKLPGKVIGLLPGRDGKVRTLKIRCKNSEIIRPIQRVYPLEVPIESNENVKFDGVAASSSSKVNDIITHNEVIKNKRLDTCQNLISKQLLELKDAVQEYLDMQDAENYRDRYIEMCSRVDLKIRETVAPTETEKRKDLNCKETEIGLLIGADNIGKLLTGDLIKLDSGLTALETKLGGTVIGKLSSDVKNAMLTTSSLHVRNVSVKDLWELDVLEIPYLLRMREKILI
ncbi:uncharacterized protein TNIN_408511 [Trichonephila inaurata madagascariensis]|uniref:Uncharacterized protein n=1 Tax=Trichonephila inaurata madagascariensis TaxID=2747483 RepID=A0A8X6YHC3_9ARAC|nr:uncharacterized protein TNIN_408511 [Trichonephila inaurata madagascariensis]